MSARSQAQKRGQHALDKIKALAERGQARYGNYRAYVNALPATIITNGLGQALAMEYAGRKRDKGHAALFDHVEDWLLTGWEQGPYCGQRKILDAIVGGTQAEYVRAQAEAMAYLEWLKKFATAMLQKPQGEDEGETPEVAEA